MTDRYRWQGMDSQGNRHRGVVSAASAAQARRELREQGYIILSMQQSEERRAFGPRFSRRVPAAAITLFTRQLATLVNAAIPLAQALKIIAAQNENALLAKQLATIRERVLEGYALHEALQACPKSFDKLFRTLVVAGEKTGRLGEVLEKLADHNEQQQMLRNKLTQAMIYPTALTLVALGVIGILLAVVVPQVTEQFVNMKQALPLSTRLLLMLSHAVQQYGLPCLGLLAAAGLLFRIWLKKPNNLLRFQRGMVRYPPCGKLVRTLNAARYLRTLTILQHSHVPLLEAMEIARTVNANEYVNTLMQEAAGKVRQGVPLSRSLEQTALFPAMMIYMIASGEQSGQLSVLMARATEYQEKQLQHRITLMLAVFEPLLVITMASIVLFIVLSILQPILQLNNLVS
ncbi:type II secretion system inner membrane protein GspF [Pantoea osteomyelitidis]|uniref:General secretion pathway protein F n=1 Tax=Pantoea osteomyelitidis TaxID=3230026 RepID=A0ABW7PRQ8_9GAMM